ncbi:MAG: hypothetical protein JWN52_6192, partial [Actinomycetia bacterium]|nr:hypothetical protein [Actinomycetes bacterium]
SPAGAGGRGPAGRGPGCPGAAGLAGLAPCEPEDLPEDLPNASVSLRTTGASIVEDAERTNSPISWSLAMTTLLSTPNSWASSYTRTFATTLPTRSGGSPPDLGYLAVLIAGCSSSAHSNLDLLPTRRHLLFNRPATAAGRPCPRGALATCKRRAAPPGGRPGETPDDALRGRDMPGRDAKRHPVPAADRADRGQQSPRPRPGAAGRTWPRAPGSPHTCAAGPLGHVPRVYRAEASAAPLACPLGVSAVSDTDPDLTAFARF